MDFRYIWVFFKSASSTIKKVAIIAIVFSAIVLVFISNIKNSHIQYSQEKAARQEDSLRQHLYSVVNNPALQNSEGGKKFASVYKTTFCIMIGELCSDKYVKDHNYFDESVFGYMSKAISVPLTHPASSGMLWVSASLQETGFVPKTMAAQGIGFAALQPFQSIWKVFRDLSFMILILIVTGIGLAIMFRFKINPQTVVTMENAIPRIVFALILIHFSYAIAGFLIDLMYVSIFFIVSLLANNGITSYNAAEITDKVVTSGLFLVDDLLVDSSFWDIGYSLLNVLPNAVASSVRLISGVTATFLAYKAVGAIIGEGLGPVRIPVAIILTILTFPLGFVIAGIIISLLVFFTAIFLYFRIFFLLFKAYLKVLNLVLFAPLILLSSAIPGQKVFMMWFKNLLGNLVSFPVVTAILLVSDIIMQSGTGERGFWSPPYITSSDPHAFNVIIAVGMLFLIPNLVKIVREFLGFKESSLPFGPALFFGALGGAAGGGISTLGQFQGITMGLGMLGRAGPLQGSKILQKFSQMATGAHGTHMGGGGSGGGGSSHP